MPRATNGKFPSQNNGEGKNAPNSWDVLVGNNKLTLTGNIISNNTTKDTSAIFIDISLFLSRKNSNNNMLNAIKKKVSNILLRTIG